MRLVVNYGFCSYSHTVYTEYCHTNVLKCTQFMERLYKYVRTLILQSREGCRTNDVYIRLSNDVLSFMDYDIFSSANGSNRIVWYRTVRSTVLLRYYSTVQVVQHALLSFPHHTTPKPTKSTHTASKHIDSIASSRHPSSSTIYHCLPSKKTTQSFTVVKSFKERQNSRQKETGTSSLRPIQDALFFFFFLFDRSLLFFALSSLGQGTREIQVICCLYVLYG